MAKLEDRLKECGFYEMSQRATAMEREAALAEAVLGSLTGDEAERMRPRAEELREEAEQANQALADLYNSTVKLVDSRNMYELDLLQLIEGALLSAEEMRKTDPEEAARMLTAIGIDENGNLLPRD